VKDSSIKFSLSTLTLLGLAAVASTPALANSAPSSEHSQTQTIERPEQELPFFARFLEGQQPEVANERVVLTADRIIETKPLNRPGDLGGKETVVTNKFPSDAEDNTGGGIVTTRKYPSDAEDNTGGGIVTTRKYPSDAEDNTGGGTVTTQKYPSDGEDGGIVPPRRQR
jgi:hypothetical protein